VSGLATDGPSQVFFCVADGVGSWRQYGVDPRLFAHRLVKNAERVVLSDAQQRSLLNDAGWAASGNGMAGRFSSRYVRALQMDVLLVDQQPIHPLDVLVDAWNLTNAEKVTGSSTICVATIDKSMNQLSYSNIGDCGLMVVRHIDSETAGYMR
jgi:protein phosphatase PTC7